MKPYHGIILLYNAQCSRETLLHSAECLSLNERINLRIINDRSRTCFRDTLVRVIVIDFDETVLGDGLYQRAERISSVVPSRMRLYLTRFYLSTVIQVRVVGRSLPVNRAIPCNLVLRVASRLSSPYVIKGPRGTLTDLLPLLYYPL